MNDSLQAKSAPVVFSGGQDSTTCLHWAIKHFDALRTLTFDYGQRHRMELECAKQNAELAKVPHEVLSIGTFTELGGNALTETKRLKFKKRKATGKIYQIHLCQDVIQFY